MARGRVPKGDSDRVGRQVVKRHPARGARALARRLLPPPLARLLRTLRRLGVSAVPFRPATPEGEVVWCSPSEILLRQYRGTTCQRLDLFVRMLALEEFTGSSRGGRDLYAKYRGVRRAGEKSVEYFHGLLASVRGGFDPERPVDVSRDGGIVDGAHRLACALVLGTEQVPVRIGPAQERPYRVPVQWFRANGFTRDEVALLLAAAERYRRAAAAHAARP